jgi:hypothetical protein
MGSRRIREFEVTELHSVTTKVIWQEHSQRSTTPRTPLYYKTWQAIKLIASCKWLLNTLNRFLN